MPDNWAADGDRRLGHSLHCHCLDSYQYQEGIRQGGTLAGDVDRRSHRRAAVRGSVVHTAGGLHRYAVGETGDRLCGPVRGHIDCRGDGQSSLE